MDLDSSRILHLFTFVTQLVIRVITQRLTCEQELSVNTGVCDLESDPSLYWCNMELIPEDNICKFIR